MIEYELIRGDRPDGDCDICHKAITHGDLLLWDMDGDNGLHEACTPPSRAGKPTFTLLADPTPCEAFIGSDEAGFDPFSDKPCTRTAAYRVNRPSGSRLRDENECMHHLHWQGYFTSYTIKGGR